MRCERCQGIGFIDPDDPSWPRNGRGGGCKMNIKQPCPDCQGTGISYCCDEAGANPPNTFEDVSDVHSDRS